MSDQHAGERDGSDLPIVNAHTTVEEERERREKMERLQREHATNLSGGRDTGQGAPRTESDDAGRLHARANEDVSEG